MGAPSKVGIPEQTDARLRRAIAQLELDRHTVVSVRELLAGGMSGALVALVDCSGGLDGIFVLKADLTTKGRIDEDARHRRALELGAFSGKLPDLVACSHTGDACCMLFRLAGGSRLTWRPLVGSTRVLRSAYRELGRALWTPNLVKFGQENLAFAILPELLRHRLDASLGGRIHEHVRELAPSLENSSHFVHLDGKLPNPLYLATHPEAIKVSLRPLLGPTHGDLHAANLFARVNGNAGTEDICLIDLASFVEFAPLFYDQAYFELSMLLRTFPGLAPRRWLDLCQALLPGNAAAVDDLDPGERGWAADLLAARLEMMSAPFAAYPDREDDLRLQWLVVQTAAGLSFLNKLSRKSGSGSLGLTSEQYEQSLVWAGVAVAQFLSAANLELPTIAAQIPAVGPTTLVADHIDEADWQAVSRFEDAGLNILILSEQARTEDAERLQTIFRVRWNVVLDLSPEPTPDPAVLAAPRAVRVTWPTGESPDSGLLDRGLSWIHINGRTDLSSCPPATDDVNWRRTYRRYAEDVLEAIARDLGPASVRVVFWGRKFGSEQFRGIAEALDRAFNTAMCPPLVAGNHHSLAALALPKVIVATETAILSRFAATLSSVAVAHQGNQAMAPKRDATGIALAVVPEELVRRAERDLTIVHRGLAENVPAGRTFGVDFQRGMAIEWAELAANLDVPREAFRTHRTALLARLQESTNATYNLLHQPSAGGSTLARRLAWSLMADYPTVVLNQFTPDTAAYLRDLFRFTSLPLLVLMESNVVTESGRESLLSQLREDNTRAVFLWVSRVYRESKGGNVLDAALSPEEAGRFLDSYRAQTSDSAREAALVQLAHSPGLEDQRSPFFFGLVAFGNHYLGLERLISETLEPLTPNGKAVVADLCLLAAYSDEAYASADFDEICKNFNDGKRPFDSLSPLVFEHGHYLRISHNLIAQRLLQDLARDPARWRADLGRFSEQFLEHVARLRSASSKRVRRLVEALFVTRDTATILQVDGDAVAGGLPRQRRFAPLVEEIGNASAARHILSILHNRWPTDAHFAVHYARHLLYEAPQEVARAVALMEAACRSAEGKDDDVVVHMLGMCYRQRLQDAMQSAIEAKEDFGAIAPLLRRDFVATMDQFARAIELNPSKDHGRVSSIQTVQRLLTHAKTLAGAKSLAELLNTKGQVDWLADALALAEAQILALRERPTGTLALRAKHVIAEWELVYGNVDAVISNLRNLAKNHEDAAIRRALYHAICAKHGRRWQAIPHGDLRTIEELARRNVEGQGVRDADVRSWLMAYRHLPTFDIDTCIRRLTEWQELRPSSLEPAFYLYVFRALQYIDSEPRNAAYALEATRWLRVSSSHRQVGQRNWGYEWLTRKGKGQLSTHFNELDFDPVHAIRSDDAQLNRKASAFLSRLTGTLSEYRGPQQARVDLGHGLTIHVTPLDRLNKDHLGRRVSVFVSFGYDGAVGWDPQLVNA